MWSILFLCSKTPYAFLLTGSISILQNKAQELRSIFFPSCRIAPSQHLWLLLYSSTICSCCSVPQLCPTLCDSMDCSMPVFPVLHHFPKLLKFMSIELVMPSNHLILCHPLFLLTSIFPSIRVFSNELALCIRWPKYWSFSFSISPSNEYSGLISFRTDWFDLAVQGTLKSLLHVQMHQFFSTQPSFWSNSHIRTWPQDKP